MRCISALALFFNKSRLCSGSHTFHIAFGWLFLRMNARLNERIDV